MICARRQNQTTVQVCTFRFCIKSKRVRACFKPTKVYTSIGHRTIDGRLINTVYNFASIRSTEVCMRACRIFKTGLLAPRIGSQHTVVEVLNDLFFRIVKRRKRNIVKRHTASQFRIVVDENNTKILIILIETKRQLIGIAISRYELVKLFTCFVVKGRTACPFHHAFRIHRHTVNDLQDCRIFARKRCIKFEFINTFRYVTEGNNKLFNSRNVQSSLACFYSYDTILRVNTIFRRIRPIRNTVKTYRAFGQSVEPIGIEHQFFNRNIVDDYATRSVKIGIDETQFCVAAFMIKNKRI